MNDTPHQATWIWYPGDYEIWLHQKVSMMRQFRGYICPPLWRLDTPYVSIRFRKTFELTEAEQLTLAVQGQYVILMDGSMTPIPCDRKPVTTILLPAGRHTLVIDVYNDRNIPAVYAAGAQVVTDSTWEVTALNNKWVPAASWQFHDLEKPPASFPFSYETVQPVSVSQLEGGMLVDFGRETFGYVTFLGVKGKGKIHLYYGESREEAMAGELAETFDELEVGSEGPGDYTTPVTRAFRYVQVKAETGVSFRQVQHQYEYLPMERRGAFRCSDDRLNKIWELSARTLHINMREFVYDGMKRDRWVWSGDANLSFFLNHYVFFEQDVTKRTLVALRGKEPVENHINTIMDYTFYWFLSLYEYHLYTGDLEFIRTLYPKALSLMAFCLGRRNEEGMMEGYPGDWVFIDWADMDLRGEVSTEQIFFCRSLEIMSFFADKLEDTENGARFREIALKLREKIFRLFWDEDRGGLIHSRFNGELNRTMLKYPNIFAVRFGYLDDRQQELVRQSVMKNDAIQKIKTPFMRFYELDTLCQLGEQEYVLNEIRSYWGGMLDLGATSFWEEYDPTLPAEEQYHMYGDKFRKSLCHAWGAAPAYLLGRYVLGVEPEAPAYEQYRVEPYLGDLDWIEGTVPTPNGEITVYMDKSSIRVTTNKAGTGILRFASEVLPQANEGEITCIGENRYELILSQPEYQYEIRF